MLNLEKYKDRLEQDRAQLERLIERRQASIGEREPGGVTDTFSNSGDDECADSASDIFTQELDMSLINKHRYRLEQVRKALERLQEHTYGICIRCHTRIAAARLEAIPETPYCRDCESDVEILD